MIHELDRAPSYCPNLGTYLHFKNFSFDFLFFGDSQLVTCGLSFVS